MYGRITGISIESRIIITYVVRQMVPLGVIMKHNFEFKGLVSQSSGIFYLYYSSNDHDLFYQLHRAKEFSKLICCKVNIQKTIFRTHLGY